MTTGHVFIATSLDGFIARSDGAIDWLPHEADPAEDYGYEAFMASVDGLVIGRNTCQKALTFAEWPYPKQVIVLSRTLNAAMPELAGKAEVSSLSPRELMSLLAKRGWNRVYVDGGKLIQSFLREGLIADMVITRIPVLLGEGLPLFGPLAHDASLTHVETKSYAAGLVQSHYRF